LEVDFQVTAVNAYKVCGKTVYLPIDMLLDDRKEAGIFPILCPSYSVLVVSPRMTGGFVDYAFRSIKGFNL
jgi:hypothetical protein